MIITLKGHAKYDLHNAWPALTALHCGPPGPDDHHPILASVCGDGGTVTLDTVTRHE